MTKKLYAIADIVKALEYIRQQHATAVSVEIDDMNRLIFKNYDSGKQVESAVTVFSNDVTKKPEVTRTQTLE